MRSATGLRKIIHELGTVRAILHPLPGADSTFMLPPVKQELLVDAEKTVPGVCLFQIAGVEAGTFIPHGDANGPVGEGNGPSGVHLHISSVWSSTMPR